VFLETPASLRSRAVFPRRPDAPVWLDRLKPWLLPIYNSAHRAAWRLGEYAGAIRHRRFGRCAVCGRWGPRLYRRWIVWPELERRWGLEPLEAEALAHKESDACAFCGAKLRARRIAQALLITLGGDPPPWRSIRDWTRSPNAQRLAIAEVNEIEGLHAELARLPGFAPSEYIEGAEPGAIVDGVRCEDLTRLTYHAERFDLLLSSETLEHVPDLPKALSEIRRVLKPGGSHIFTVPVRPSVPRTFERRRINPDGAIVDAHPPIAHPGGDWGYPVFTEFGADLPERLQAAGFEVRVLFGPTRVEDLAQVYVCRKPEDAPTRTETTSEQGGVS